MWFRLVKSGHETWVGPDYPTTLKEPAPGPAASDQKSGRSPTGKLRNFGSMGDKKFGDTLAAVMAENNDPEAIAAVTAEAQKRGLWPSPAEPADELEHPTLKPKELDADGAYVTEGGFNPADWVAVGSAKVGDMAPGTVFQTKKKGLVYMKMTGATVKNLVTGKEYPAKVNAKGSVMQHKGEVAVPYEQLGPGDETTLGKLKVGDQFTAEPGGALYEVVSPPADAESDATVAPVVPGGGLGNATSEGAIPGKVVYLHAKGSGTKLSDLPLPESAVVDASQLQDANAHPSTPLVGYASKWGSGGKYQHHRIQEMAAGTVFRDKDGNVWKVKQPGANAVITDGDKNFKVNGELRGRVIDDAKALHFHDHSPALGNQDDFVQAAVAAALSVNTASTPVQSLEPGDFFESENGKTWQVATVAPDNLGDPNKFLVGAHDTETNDLKVFPGVYTPPKVGYSEQATGAADGPLNPTPKAQAASKLEPGTWFSIAPGHSDLEPGVYQALGPMPGQPGTTAVKDIDGGDHVLADHAGVNVLALKPGDEGWDALEDPAHFVDQLGAGDGFYVHDSDGYGHLTPNTEYWVYATTPSGVTVIDLDTDEMTMIPPDTVVSPSGGVYSDDTEDESLDPDFDEYLDTEDVWGGLDPEPIESLTFEQALHEFQAITLKSGTPDGLSYKEGVRYDDLLAHLAHGPGGGSGYFAAPGEEVEYHWLGETRTGTLVSWSDSGNAIIDVDGVTYEHPKGAYLARAGEPPPEVPEAPAAPPEPPGKNPFGPEAQGEAVPEQPVAVGGTVMTASQLQAGMFVQTKAGHTYEVLAV
ncbi:MAG TPA: hypothetical protein VFG68_07135, partial [Fimbriiglobus sp.]|nr:hypothetical protein [Fimbriiglobus sp.]